jgi:hypothetical protein
MVSLKPIEVAPPLTDDWTASLRAVVNADIIPLGHFDEHDPLGLAFYTFVLLRTRTITRATEKLPAAARQWAEAKLLSGDLSPYRDRDLGAVGLLFYAFAEYDIPLQGESRLGQLAMEHSTRHGLLFDSFFLTSLIALGLSRTRNGCPPELAKSIEECVSLDLDRLRNDPKALLAGFWCSETLGKTDLSERLFRAADDMFVSGTDHLDGRLCSAAILLERLEDMTMRQRLAAAAFAQDSIKSVGVEAAGFGAASREMLLLEEDRFPGEAAPVSRILVSVGLLCRDLLERKSALLLTRSARAIQIVRSVVFSALCVFAATGLLYCAGRLRPPKAVSEMLDHPSYSQAVAIFGLLIGYMTTAAILGFLGVAIYELVVGLAVTGKRKDEFAAFGEAWLTVKQHYKIDILFLLLAAVIFDFLLRRG